MDNQPQDLLAPNIVKKLYHAYRFENQNKFNELYSKERKAADDAEDALFQRLSDELKGELRHVIYLRAEVNELDASDIFTDGFIYGAELILNILRPKKPV
jgi:hypothetical protein